MLPHSRKSALLMSNRIPEIVKKRSVSCGGWSASFNDRARKEGKLVFDGMTKRKTPAKYLPQLSL